ncbi:rRNA methyltransferase 1, mitochondrial-like isoform X1 [Saccostrea echinata]|uniref:rRNA methyltransferase 1, mitochondrial-like isoform X1 n=1 Tax=Saccostrea echinata TaxID=191078 RepID=UPI002A7EF057|nr:rRNA methyltransferase 1, mitochondrial-like isoform X1 [Saccostrea echinata]
MPVLLRRIKMSHASHRLICRRFLYGCMLSERRSFVKSIAVNGKGHAPGKGEYMPEYNYRLPGRGKRSQKSFDDQELGVAVRGEILFGVHPISLALRANKRKLYKLYLKQNTTFRAEGEKVLQMANKLSVPMTFVDKGVLEKLSGSRPNQGMCLDVSQLPVPWAGSSQVRTELKESKWRYPLWLMPYNVQDPMNFGAILRTTYFLGIDKVLAPQKESCSLSPVVSKASSGALELINLARFKEMQDMIDLLQEWKQAGGEVIGTSVVATRDVPVTPLPQLVVDKPILLIVGNEERGISSTLMEKCDQVVYIPGCDAGLIGSLNVSVATGIILQHLVSHNEKKEQKTT